VGSAFELPGGLLRGGRLHREVHLRPLTGRVELEVDEALALDGLEQVDALLVALVAWIGEVESSLERVRELCVVDRQFALVRVAALLRGSTAWITDRCTGCGAVVDLELELDQLPVAPAGPGYPECVQQFEGRRVRVRVPTGMDQHTLTKGDETAAVAELLRRCAQPLDGEGELDARSFDAIDQAIEAMSPGIATTLTTTCPECRRERQIEFDPYALAMAPPGEPDVFDEIHTLAFHYHWGENEILALPRARRHRYLRRIEAALGSGGEVAP
jgi:hypothetical protein